MYIKNLNYNQVSFFQRDYNFFENYPLQVKILAYEILVLVSHLQSSQKYSLSKLRHEKFKKTKAKGSTTELLNTPKSKY